MGPIKFSLVAIVLVALSRGTLAQLNGISGNGGLFGGESGGDLSSGDNVGYPGETNGYLPPAIGSPSDGVSTVVKPPGYNEGATNEGPAISPPFAPAQPQLGCAAALLCVEEQLCSMTGIILESPISLTEEQKLRRVPMVDCRNPDNGIIGKCCRDPNYVDPWPAGNLPTNYTGGFDEQGFPKFLNLSKNKNNKKPIVPQQPFQGNNRPFTNQPVNQPLQPQSTNQFPTTNQPNKFGPLQPQSSNQFTVPAHPVQSTPQHSIGSIQTATPIRPVGPAQPTGPIHQTPVQPLVNVPQKVTVPIGKNPFLHPTPTISQVSPPRPFGTQQTQQPHQQLPSKTFPNFPGFEQIPNAINNLNPFKPQPDSQIIEAPQDVPNVPLADVTTKRPGFFPNLPSFGFGKGTGNTPIAETSVVIAPHTPGAQCGIINKVQHAGGLGDVDVAFGEIPWQAMILHNSEKKLLCSGAIVAPNLILTSAHCVYGQQASQVSVKAGEWKLNYELKHEEPLPFEILQVKTIEVHPNYQPGAPGFDIAMLFLQSSFKLDLHVDTICVADQPAVSPQRKCISTGWGKEVLELHVSGAVMHKIDVDVIGNDQCRQRVQGAESSVDLDDSLVCVKAHRQNNNMCQVDVGGPLACDRGDGNYELVGVYSQDTGCLPTNQVATFALVDNWVTDMISSGEQLAPQSTIGQEGPRPITDQIQSTFQQGRPATTVGLTQTTFQHGAGHNGGQIQSTFQQGRPATNEGQTQTIVQHGSTPSTGQILTTFQQGRPATNVGQTQTIVQHGSTPSTGHILTTFQQGSPATTVGHTQITFQQGRPATTVGLTQTTFQHGSSPISNQPQTTFQHGSVGQTQVVAQQTNRPAAVVGNTQTIVQQPGKIHYHQNQPDVPCDCQQGTQPAGLNQYLPPV